MFTTFQYVLLCTQKGRMRPHQNAFCTLVYMIECIMYLCVLNRMQWVLLCSQLARLMYFDVHRIGCRELDPVYTKSQLLPANRVNQFYEPSESMILSLTQIINIIGKYILLCNCFALSHIEFAFAMGPPWNGINHVPHCYGNWVAMETRLKPQILLCLRPY